MRSRQTREYLQKADIISVDYRDRKQILDLIEDYPTKDIIVKIKYLDKLKEEGIEWKYLESMGKVMEGKGTNLVICLPDLDMVPECANRDLKFYYGYPIKTFYELDSLLALGVEWIRIAPPLTHRMEALKNVNGVKILAVPNVAYDDAIKHSNGVIGGWIRPEDLTTTYADYIDAVEFEDCDIKKEQALYRLYFEDKAWPGDISMIISNLDYKATNRMIPPDFAKARLNCQQKCLENSRCRLCYRYLDLANPGIYEYMKK